MARATQKRLPADERRALIVEAAGHLFGQRGYAGTTLDDIAAAANVTKPMLYRHFDSKKALYLALLARHRDDLPRFAAEVASDVSPESRVEAILDSWLQYVEQHGYAWRMLFRDTTGDEEIQAFRLAVQARAREVMAALLEQEPEISVPPQAVEPLAEFLRAGGAGLALWWLDHPEVPRAVLLDALIAIVRGLSASGRA
jgi:AcrR family transcriptional regulator